MVGKYISEKIRLSIWLGAGTMGVVWRAEHLELGLAVAVKLMPSGSPDDAQLRFRNEAITAQRFKSPHIVRIFEHGRTNEGIPYLVMELLEGEDLRRHVQRVGPLPLAKVAGIFAQVTRALEEARNLDIVHRDIKPANLFLVESDGDPIVKVLRSGNINADTPPASFVTIRNMAMNFDGSGPTQEAIVVTTVDGVEMHKTRTVYGAAFLSTQVTEDLNAGLPIGTGGLKHGPVIGAAASFWGIVQQETTETLYDYTTRYVTGSKMTGFKKGRYKQETDGLEVLGLVGATDSQSQYEKTLYEFKEFPTYAVEQKVLEQFAQHYGDAQLTPIPSEMVKRCNPDGSSSMVSIKDPNFVEPMAVMATLSYSTSFAHTRNPDTTPDEPLPDLTQGEERLHESAIEILDSNSTRVRTNDKNYKFKTNEDQFISFEYETGSQGAQFGEYVGKRTFSSSSGRPGAAQKLPDIYEKEEPEAISGNPNIYKLPQEANFDYVLCTPGYTPNDPSTSSIGFPKAIYLAQGIVGAETDLKYKDIQESIEFSATIPTNHQIRPLDYVNLNDGGTTHKTRVISVENTILIQGLLDGYPLLVAPRNTVLKAGIDRTIPFTITRRRLSGGGTIFNSRTFGLTIGEIVPPTLQGRGNY